MRTEQNERASVGDLAPDFTLPNTAGEMVSLSDFRGKKEVVLYFYPKDNSSGCTAEACAFRDNYAVIADLNAEVLGVSSDSQESHQGFASQYRLPFPLLSDEGGAVRKRYGVPQTLGLIPGRVTYVIDKQGIIRHIFTSQINIERHIAEALTTLRQLNAQP
ncbi:MAG TPA: peroxiredoxin [Ktedonobacterales bacterium]|jgi:peroxiredoxin Q/BCP|nr:peroxiredoxin [Ktedonobacterales bacterium]